MMWLAAGVVLGTFAVGWCVGWWSGFKDGVDVAMDLDPEGLRKAVEALDKGEL